MSEPTPATVSRGNGLPCPAPYTLRGEFDVALFRGAVAVVFRDPCAPMPRRAASFAIRGDTLVLTESGADTLLVPGLGAEELDAVRRCGRVLLTDEVSHRELMVATFPFSG